MFFLRAKQWGKALASVMVAVTLLSGCESILVDNGAAAGKDAEIKVDVAEREIIPPGAIPGEVTIDLSSVREGESLNLHGLSKAEALERIGSLYDFNLKIINGVPDKDIYGALSDSDLILSENKIERVSSVSYDNIGTESFDIPDIIGSGAEVLLNEIYEKYENGSREDSGSFALVLPFEEYADIYSSLLHDAWSVDAASGAITSYDSENDEFIFGNGHEGYEIDRETLKQNILDCFEKRNFDTEIEAMGNIITLPDYSLKDKYETLASYETHTTNQSVRNKNVSLAADAINGRIVMPGEEFSYNETVGKRTREKGYGEAGAYLNGEVVQEIGGGVCQVSTTTYNAVFRAGLRSTERTSHTFAPSYVTPGLDATVSWGGPDYKFVNDSPYPIGIRAHYENRKVKVSIYGVRVLPEGITLDLVSYKTASLGVPAPVYITSGKTDNGSAGSIWEAYKVTYKDGEEIDRVFDHKSKYVGHTPRIMVNPLLPPGMTQEEYDAWLQNALTQAQAAPIPEAQ